MGDGDINDTHVAQGDDAARARNDNARKFSAAPADSATQRQGKALAFRQHRDGNASAPRYLIKRLLPETGTALLSGQWGSFKTFVAVAMAAAVATGDAFIGHSIKRRGAVLFFALEGVGDLSSRIDAVSIDQHENDRLPIFYTDHEIELLEPLSVADIIVTASLVNDKAKEYGLPLALIVIDTLTAAAGYSCAGDENDSSIAQRVMNALAEISRTTGALVLALDHHGKTAEAGTRGSSAKEASADTVLAILADKSTVGKVTNTRLVVRKQRTGQAGAEFPFRTKLVELGLDDDDEPFHSLAIEFFEPEGQPISQPEGAGWTRSLSALRRILMSMLADAGENIRPFPDGPEVRAVRSKIVRDEFYRQFAGSDDDPKKKSAAQRKAWNRALGAAQRNNLLGIRELDGVQWLWLLASSQDGTGGTGTPPL